MVCQVWKKDLNRDEREINQASRFRSYALVSVDLARQLPPFSSSLVVQISHTSTSLCAFEFRRYPRSAVVLFCTSSEWLHATWPRRRENERWFAMIGSSNYHVLFRLLRLQEIQDCIDNHVVFLMRWIPAREKSALDIYENGPSCLPTDRVPDIVISRQIVEDCIDENLSVLAMTVEFR